MTAKVLITGITGMVGSHLAEYLYKNTDWKIYGTHRWRSSLINLKNLIPIINNGNSRLELKYADLTDFQSIRNTVKNVKPDYVFHLAAQSYPKTSFDAPIDTYTTNILGTSILLEAIKEFASHAYIHVCSSSEVFGRVSADKLPIKEECSFHPASPYAISKVGTDLIGKFYSEAYGLNVITTRMFTHTGPRRGDIFAESSFAKQIAMIEKGLIPPIIKVGNLNSLRTVADVRDAVRAYYMLLTVNPIKGEAYNIGGNKTLTVGQILESLLSLCSYSGPISIVEDPDRIRPIDADLQIPDTSKFRLHTGWEPEFTFEDTMSDLLDYWREMISDHGNSFLIR